MRQRVPSNSQGRLVTRRHRIEVAFHHVDMMRVVHNAEYFKWFELGRLQIVHEIIPLHEALEENLSIPVVLNHCEYRHPAAFQDRLVVTTTHRILPVWEGRFLFNHTISNEKTKQELCFGKSEVTVLDLKVKRVVKEIPERIWTRYQALE